MIKIGLLATLVGPYRLNGEDGVRGAQLALAEFDHHVAGHDLQLHIQSTNAMGSSATDGATQLLEDKKVDVIVGPLSGDEAIAIREFSKHHPDHVFVNGASGSEPIYNPSPNFYTFSATGVQTVWGLGEFCYQELGYQRMATIGVAYSYMYSQIGSFVLNYCEAGGKIAKHIWCGLGTEDYSTSIAEIPADADAIFLALGGRDAINFIEQYHAQQGTLPIVAGSLVGDQSVLNIVGDYAHILDGVFSASMVSDGNPDPIWQDFVAYYREAFPDEGFYYPANHSFCYYTNLKAILLALQAVDGDLSNGQADLKQALSELSFRAPTCKIRLDHHRTVITDIFVNQIQVTDDGHLYTHLIKRIPEVNCTLGLSDDEYLALGKFHMQNMPTGRRKSLNPLQERLEQFKRKQNPND